MTQLIEYYPGSDLPTDSDGRPLNGYTDYDIGELTGHPDDDSDNNDRNVAIEPLGTNKAAIEEYDAKFDREWDKLGSAPLARAALGRRGIFPPDGYAD